MTSVGVLMSVFSTSGGGGGGGGGFTPFNQTFGASSGSVTVPSGASSLTIGLSAAGGRGGNGASGNLDHGGGGAGSGADCFKTVAVVSADWGTTLSFTVGAGGGITGGSSTVTGTIAAGTINMFASGGVGGTSATSSTSGTGGAGGTAAGGGTNHNGNGGSNGSNVAGGTGGAVPSGGTGKGGDAGYGFGSPGNAGLDGFATFAWS